MPEQVNRREFLVAGTVGLAVAGSATAENAPLIARRTLGKTGGQVSILGFGGGSRFLMYENEDQATAVLNEAFDSGINYLDTAIGYGDGVSETRCGRVVKHRRRELWLTTKVQDRTYDGTLKAIEQSLKRLQTDHVDLFHIHSLGDMDDLKAIEAPNGVLKAMYRIREQKLARFIGVTSHSDAATLKTALERHDFDCVQMALNAATNTGHATGFERMALPVALSKNMGILAMKIAGQDNLVGTAAGKARMRDLLNYSLSLPVAACVVGMPKLEMLRENIAIARAFKPLTEAEKDSVRKQVELSVAAFDQFLRNHQDCHPA